MWIFQCPGCGKAAAVGLGPIHRAEVTRQGCRGGIVGSGADRVAALSGSLITAEEEQLVSDDSSSGRAAELVALQRVADRL